MHVNYPHSEGYLYDCNDCESGPCVCAGHQGWSPCLSMNCERIDEQ